MGLRPFKICQFFQFGDRLYTSESDVYRRHILTYKDGFRAGRVEATQSGQNHYFFFWLLYMAILCQYVHSQNWVSSLHFVLHIYQLKEK